MPSSKLIGMLTDAALLADTERLLRYLVDHMLAGYEQDDDVTVLVMHRPPEGAQ